MLFIMNLIAPDSMLSAAHLKVMKKVNEKDYSPIRQNSDKLERTTLDDRKFLGNRNIISPDIRFSADQLKGMKPITVENFSPVRENLVKLGRLLFYDPILSGNRNISCGTCHHH